MSEQSKSFLADPTALNISSASDAAPPAPPPVALKRSTPVIVCMRDVRPRKVEWLWPGRIPLGSITLLIGMPGVGKSFCVCDIAARVSCGRHWPDSAPTPRGAALLISAEDDPRATLRTRLEAADAELSNVHLLEGIRNGDAAAPTALFNLTDLRSLSDALDKINEVRLVVIDPIGSYLGDAGDTYRETLVRKALAPLAALADRRRLAMVLVAHRRKKSSTMADDVALGSRAFTGVARSVLHLCRDVEQRDRRLLVPGKCNLTMQTPGISFTIAGSPPRVHWGAQPLQLTADDMLAYERQDRGRPASELDAAAQWLEDQLCDRRLHAIDDLKKSAAAAGHAWRTVERARQKLGAVSHRLVLGGPSSWSIDDDPRMNSQEMMQSTSMG